MDLSLLPSSCSKLNKIDKTAIENDRKEFWDLFYKKVKLVVFMHGLSQQMFSMRRLEKQTRRKKRQTKGT